MNEDSIFVRALDMPVDKRAELAAELLRSLDGEPEQDAEAAWAAEIDKRIRDAEAGEARFEDWQVVRDRTRARLRKK